MLSYKNILKQSINLYTDATLVINWFFKFLAILKQTFGKYSYKFDLGYFEVSSSICILLL